MDKEKAMEEMELDIKVEDSKVDTQIVDDEEATQPIHNILAIPEPLSADPINIDLTEKFGIDKEFDTIKEAKEWIKELGKSLGSFVSIKKSDYSKTRRNYADFRCERSGKVRDHVKGGKYVKKLGGEGKNAPRPSRTKLNDCPFFVKCMQNKENTRWRFYVMVGYHNHPLAQHGVGHSVAGQLSKSEKDLVHTMSRTGGKPRYILKHLKSQDPNCAVTPKTIYNEVQMMKKVDMGGRSIVQEVFNLADRENTFIRHSRSDGSIKNIFWTINNSRRLANTFHTVFMIDCTYRTNRYKMPLLHIVGVTSTVISFSAGFALLSSEKEEDYIWALRMFRETLNDNNVPACIVTDREIALMKAISTVFPESHSILCRWHIQNDVKSYIRKNVKDNKLWKPMIDKWGWITYCEDENDINRLLGEVNEMSNVIFDYMQNTWVNNYKEMFIEAWTNKLLHLGNTSTSRVEGVHGVLKKWLDNATGDLVTHWKAIESVVGTQVDKINASFEISLFKFPKALIELQWCKLLRESVSLYAIEQIKREIGRMDFVRGNIELCGCVLRKTLGIPCAHELWLILQKRKTIPANALHNHWRKLTLDDLPKPSFDKEGGCDPHVLVNIFMAKYESETVERKNQMIHRLKEAIDPRNTNLKEPPILRKPKGRPKGSQGKKFTIKNDEDSTKRDPSYWEHVFMATSQVSVTKGKDTKEEDKEKKRKELDSQEEVKKKKMKPKTDDEQNEFVSDHYFHQYLQFIPDILHQYVEKIEDVDKDGNCGFRAVAKGLGLDENIWPNIRQRLWGELKDKKELYQRVMIEDGLPDKILDKLLWSKGSCRSYYWMDAPTTLWVVAELFGVGVSLLSPSACVTCLPLTKPPLNDNPTHIWLVWANKNHFALVHMKKDSPIPPVLYPWIEVKNSNAVSWEVLYRNRIEVGRKLFINDNGGVHCID